MEYGLDYAMHRHDIERLEEVSMNDVNEKIALGWKPLLGGVIIAATRFPSDGEVESEFWFVMGVPRPKECEKHPDEIKAYYLRDDDWHCQKCLAAQE